MLPAEEKKKREVEGMDWRGPVLNVVVKDLIQMGTFDTDVRESSTNHAEIWGRIPGGGKTKSKDPQMGQMRR